MPVKCFKVWKSPAIAKHDTESKCEACLSCCLYLNQITLTVEAEYFWQSWAVVCCQFRGVHSLQLLGNCSLWWYSWNIDNFCSLIPFICLGTHTGTEVIVLKAIPLTHCEDKVRYYAREITPTGTALATYEVNSITGVVTVKTGANLRSFTVSSKHWQHMHTTVMYVIDMLANSMLWLYSRAYIEELSVLQKLFSTYTSLCS